MNTIEELLDGMEVTTSQAAELFDTLPSANEALMIGRWRGYEVKTEHSMVGYLEHGGWYGKQFVDKDNVHPLLFWRRVNRSLYSVNPRLMPFTWKVPKVKMLGVFIRIARPILRTKKSRARLRMVEYRDLLSAAMVYDQKPIMDSFRRVDDNCVMGAMDMKGLGDPYFFILKRDQGNLTMKI